MGLVTLVGLVGLTITQLGFMGWSGYCWVFSGYFDRPQKYFQMEVWSLMILKDPEVFDGPKINSIKSMNLDDPKSSTIQNDFQLAVGTLAL